MQVVQHGLGSPVEPEPPACSPRSPAPECLWGLDPTSRSRANAVRGRRGSGADQSGDLLCPPAVGGRGSDARASHQPPNRRARTTGAVKQLRASQGWNSHAGVAAGSVRVLFSGDSGRALPSCQDSARTPPGKGGGRGCCGVPRRRLGAFRLSRVAVEHTCVDNNKQPQASIEHLDLAQALGWCGERIARDLHESHGGGQFTAAPSGPTATASGPRSLDIGPGNHRTLAAVRCVDGWCCPLKQALAGSVLTARS